jgi:hypothetical protein
VNGSSSSSSSAWSRAFVPAHHCCVSSRSRHGLVGVVAARAEQVESLAVMASSSCMSRRRLPCQLQWRRPQIRQQCQYARPPSSQCAAIAKALLQSRADGRRPRPSATGTCGKECRPVPQPDPLGRSLRGVLGDERRDQVRYSCLVLSRQHGVARQDAMAQRVEAGDPGAANLGRQRGLGLVHFHSSFYPCGCLSAPAAVRRKARALRPRAPRRRRLVRAGAHRFAATSPSASAEMARRSRCCRRGVA